jgi:hypothetical protein
MFLFMIKFTCWTKMFLFMIKFTCDKTNVTTPLIILCCVFQQRINLGKYIKDIKTSNILEYEIALCRKRFPPETFTN